MKIKVLYITPTLGEKEACGVGLYGKLWGDALADLENFELKVLYTDSVEEALSMVQTYSPQVVFYMYHIGATRWMADPVLRQSFPEIKHVAILHDVQQHEIDNFNP